MPFLTPFGFRAPAAGQAIQGFVDVPFKHQYWYRTGTNGYDQLLFQGNVRVWEDGSLGFTGDIWTNSSTSDRMYQVWVGANETTGRQVDLGLAPQGGATQAIDVTVRPETPGQYVWLLFGTPVSNGWLDKVRVFEYPTSGSDPWRFPIVINSSTQSTGEGSGDTTQSTITRTIADTTNVEMVLGSSGTWGIIYSIEMTDAFVGTNFVIELNTPTSGTYNRARANLGGAADGIYWYLVHAVSGTNSQVGAGQLGPILDEAYYTFDSGLNPAELMSAFSYGLFNYYALAPQVHVIPFASATDTVDVNFVNTGELPINFVSATVDPSYSTAVTFGGGLDSTLAPGAVSSQALTINTTAGLTYSRVIITYNINGGPNKEHYMDFGT